MRKIIHLLLLVSLSLPAFSQEEEKEEKKSFKSENLFTGASFSLGFGSDVFVAGINPYFGYSVARWLDAGIAVNFSYQSERNIDGYNIRGKQFIYGGGAFTRIYPVKFLFLQAQWERNAVDINYYDQNTGDRLLSDKYGVSSTLVGGGYATGRDPDDKGPYFYMSLLFDLSDNAKSPYTDERGKPLPIVRAGIQIPLFQKRYLE
jgi:hypothetical protein